MDIQDFLEHKKKHKKVENSELFRIPPADINKDLPHMKNNITKKDIMHEADILYLPTSQFGFKYALMVCDVFNAKLDAVALKEIGSSDIIKGFTTIYKDHDILDYPLRIQMDRGKEFYNKDVKDFFKTKKIDTKYTLTNRHRQNGAIEKQNFRLANLILQFQAHKELKNKKKSTGWHNHLTEFIKFLNELSDKAFKKHYKPYDNNVDIASNDVMVKMLDEGDRVLKVLDYPIRAFDKKRVIGSDKFRAGDVRWSDHIYKIMHIIVNPNMPILYMLNKKDEPEQIDPSVAYTRNQLQLIK